MIRPPIQSVKHIQQHQGVSIIATNTAQLTILQAEKDYTGVENRVPVGAVVKAVYIELWVLGTADNAPCNMSLTFEKLPGTAGSMTHAEALDLDTYANKSNILYITQGLTAENDGNPIPFMRGWFKVPKGKQRMGLGDRLVVNVSAFIADLDLCGVIIFKHYT